ncbi:hypothetical protein [Alloactinosynnema sp. L-07]|nr:hypothetical protein [Alloactinosynnema sp. L-07]
MTSRHLTDITFLVSLIDDPDDVLARLGPGSPEGHFEQVSVLDEPNHPAWQAGAGAWTEDARLAWDVLRHGHRI